MRIGDLWPLLKQTFAKWSEDKAPRLGAALAYYSILSLAPLLIVTIAVVGLVFGDEAARGQIVGQFHDLIGQQGAEAVQTIIQRADKPAVGTLAGLFGLITLLFGASGVFTELRDDLNLIWRANPKNAEGIMGMLRQRLFSFGMVLAIGFLLIVSLVASAALAALGKFFGGLLPLPTIVFEAANFLLSMGVITLLFAMIYKFVPDVKIDWRDVWFGAFATALLFTIGKTLIGLYLGKASVGSAYGAAGSVIIVLVWIYYSAQIFFFGAELTQVYAHSHGSWQGREQEAKPADAQPSAAPASRRPQHQPTGAIAHMASDVSRAATQATGLLSIAGILGLSWLKNRSSRTANRRPE
jgi:membrane protein